MSVSRLQRQLEEIYELDVGHNVNDYLITCPVLAQSLDGGQSTANLREKLLLRQEQDALSLSLFLHDDVVRKLCEDDPVQHIHGGNMQDFCLALEGVSHFLYLLWNAAFDRSVTLLEMEMQAEIDKFVMLVFCLEKQNRRVRPGELRKILFENVRFHERLDEVERQRYVDANNLAEKYCWKLESRYLANCSRQQTLSELRQFYRMTRLDKLRRINRYH